MAWIDVNGRAAALLPFFVATGILLFSPGSVLAQQQNPGASPPYSSYPSLGSEQVAWIGDRIFANECNRQLSCLTSWNAGEDFPSMGIGHFIWYRQGQDSIFQESFPALLRYMQANGISLPSWVEDSELQSPWLTRDEFLDDMDGNRLSELRQLLARTMDIQTAFIISRFDNALDEILASMDSPEQATRVRENFYKVAASNAPYGLYALIDYVNFKGIGVSERETYNTEGWGLKQVLLDMTQNNDPLAAFVMSARQTLANRVDNAPIQRNESRWLNGWNNRLDTYLPD